MAKSNPNVSIVPDKTPLQERLIVSNVLIRQILPWFEVDGIRRLILARPHLSQSHLPKGVAFTRRKPLGKSIRRRGQIEDVMTQWPQDDVQALRFPTLVFVHGGEADILVGDSILHCSANYAVLIPPGVPQGRGRKPHWFRTGLENACNDILWIHLRPYGAMCHISHTLNGEHRSDYGSHSVVINRQLLPLSEDIIREMEYAQPRYENVASAHLNAFLNTLIRVLNSEELHGGVTGTAENGLQQDEVSDSKLIVQRAKAYIENHFTHHLTLQDIARSSYVSRAQLARVFKEECGQTVWEYVILRRLQEAKMLLEETDMLISRVSQFSGFGPPSTFFPQFIKHIGTSPEEYRRKVRRPRTSSEKPFNL
jgi:AraC-like DNA-binding protein